MSSPSAKKNGVTTVTPEMRALVQSVVDIARKSAYEWSGVIAHVTVSDDFIKTLYETVQLEMTYLFRDAYERAMENGSNEVKTANLEGAFQTYCRYKDDDLAEAEKGVIAAIVGKL
jgi:hypothetical protein